MVLICISMSMGQLKKYHLTDWENVQNWQSWQSWKCEWVEQQRCLLQGLTASQISSPEWCCVAGTEVTLETGQQASKTVGEKHSFNSIKKILHGLAVSGELVTWRSGVLLSCRALRGWTSGVLPVLLAEDPDTETWTALAWSGGTYLCIQMTKI